jgi:hypothetical protein
MATGNVWLRVSPLAGCFLGFACASLKAASSGQIGCAEEDIVISNDEMGWGSRTWIAECHQKRFFCSAVQTGENQSQVNCKEQSSKTAAEAAPAPAKPAASSPPPAGGCQYDTQCKGDRICVGGQCVEAEKKAPEAPAEE